MLVLSRSGAKNALLLTAEFGLKLGGITDHAIIFCGDRLMPGGNDYPFFKAMGENQTRCRPIDIAVPVSCWEDTKRFLVNCEKAS